MLLFEPANAEGQLPVEMMLPVDRSVSLLDFAREGAFVEPHDAHSDAADGAAEQAAEDGAERIKAMIEAARDEAALETRRAMEAELEQQLRAERLRVARLCKEFAHDRERYFTAAETQVVRLALAVAERVLCREVKMDGTYLTGIVQAALARIADEGASTLRVRQEEVEAWQAIFPDGGANTVRVLGQEGIGEGECVLETVVGRVELGVGPQLAEIERGFTELLERC